MAAQYDVNLEKCALLKCLCGSAFAQDRLRCAHLLLKSPSFFVIEVSFESVKTLRLFVCTQNNNETLRF